MDLIINAYLIKDINNIDKFQIITTEVNYKLIRAKLEYEYKKIINIFKELKQQNLISSIFIPIDKTLIKTRGIKKLEFRRGKDTELQIKINNLIIIKKDIKKSISKIINLYK